MRERGFLDSEPSSVEITDENVREGALQTFEEALARAHAVTGEFSTEFAAKYRIEYDQKPVRQHDFNSRCNDKLFVLDDGGAVQFRGQPRSRPSQSQFYKPKGFAIQSLRRVPQSGLRQTLDILLCMPQVSLNLNVIASILMYDNPKFDANAKKEFEAYLTKSLPVLIRKQFG